MSGLIYLFRYRLRYVFLKNYQGTNVGRDAEQIIDKAYLIPMI